MEQGLVETRLVLLGHDQESIRVLSKPLGDRRAGEAVHLRFVDVLFATKFVLAGKCHDRAERAFALLQIGVERDLVLHRLLDADGYDHRPSLAAIFRLART